MTQLPYVPQPAEPWHRNCLYCGIEFRTISMMAKFCGYKCKNMYNYYKRQEKTHQAGGDFAQELRRVHQPESLDMKIARETAEAMAARGELPAALQPMDSATAFLNSMRKAMPASPSLDELAPTKAGPDGPKANIAPSDNVNIAADGAGAGSTGPANTPQSAGNDPRNGSDGSGAS